MSKAQVTVLPICDLCSSEEEVEWFCDDCQEILCNRCKISHQGGRKTKNDEIVPITGIKEHSSRKSVPILCEEHKTKISDLYCQNCQKLICVQCLVHNHRTHNTQSIETLIDFKTSELEDFEKHLLIKLSSYKKLLGEQKLQYEHYMTCVDNLMIDVKNETENIIRKFTKGRDKHLSNLSALKSKEEARFLNIFSRCDLTINDIRKSVENVRKAKEIGNAYQIITAVEDTRQKIACLPDATDPIQPQRPQLKCVCHHESALELRITNSDPEQKPLEAPESNAQIQDAELTIKESNSALSLTQMDLPVVEVEDEMNQKAALISQEGAVGVGTSTIDIGNAEVGLKSQIQGQNGFICVVCPTDNNTAWIAMLGDKHLTSVNTIGTILRTSVDVGGDVWDAVSDGDAMFITTYQGQRVLRLGNDGDSITSFSNLSSFYTRGLCLSCDKHIMVCVSSTRKYPDTNCKVMTLDSEGRIIQEIQYSNQKQLFISPLFVTSLPAGDLIVLDNMARGRYRVICLDRSGNHRYTWEGEVEGCKVDKFSPERIAHSSNNSVYITDNCNNCVYILDRDGKAKRYMLNTRHGILNPLAVTEDSKGRLWLGCKDAKLYILQ